MFKNFLRLTLGFTLFAGCVRYTPRPIDPPALEQSYRIRDLSDPNLRAFFTANLAIDSSTWPPRSLDFDALTLLAFYFSPEMDASRSAVAAAEGAIITAGARLNPSGGSRAGYTDAEQSPYAFGLGVEIPFETGGKRRIRVQRAQQLSEAARFTLGDTAWQLRSRLRATLVDHLISNRELEQRIAEEGIREEAVEIYEKRLEFGDVSRPELTVARSALASIQIEIEQLRGKVAETRSAVAGVLGLPPLALSGAEFAGVDLEKPPQEESLDIRLVQKQGLLNRLDVQRLLAEYAAAESDLQLQVARQRPNITLGPAYSFGEGANSYTIGPSLLLPLLDRNKGPIAEADARRTAAGDRFLNAQAQVIDEMDRALIAYRSALREFESADAMVSTVTREREESARRLFEAGEVDRLALVQARLESATVARLRLTALRRAQNGLGALEDAVQHPLPGGSRMLQPPLTNPREQRDGGSR